MLCRSSLKRVGGCASRRNSLSETDVFTDEFLKEPGVLLLQVFVGGLGRLLGDLLGSLAVFHRVPSVCSMSVYWVPIGDLVVVCRSPIEPRIGRLVGRPIGCLLRVSWRPLGELLVVYRPPIGCL